ncbi:BPM3 [Symbiodinium natans]|uniref:BPM3 protein n=1 Tax=Symbiodinium natans TaxID=878477 RepID=A0A812PEX6_9DINO|nr:BPM3 [Symbiodinium natans]
MADGTADCVADCTAEGLRAEIDATKQQVQAARDKGHDLRKEMVQAEERQRLRRELDKQRKTLEEEQDTNQWRRQYRRDVDEDRSGPAPRLLGQCPARRETLLVNRFDGEITNCSHRVARGEYIWKIESMSWVRSMLEQEELNYVQSKIFQVGGQDFEFAYNPDGGMLLWEPGGPGPIGTEQHGSLAVLLWEGGRIALRYRIFVKAAGKDFVQWGETRTEVLEDEHGCKAFGPDVRDGSVKDPENLGIFGLTHEELLQSQWVENDTLTVKFVLEIRLEGDCESRALTPAIEVPGPTLNQDTRALWEGGACSDVQFLVQGATIQAHSQLLCSRSEVFQKQLTAGLQESVSKVIVIEDCEPVTFKEFLKFLYTDSFPNVAEFVARKPETEDGEGGSRMSRMQALLAVSHKYQVTRLQRWCELQLCDQLTTPEVSRILCQAHLLEATHLERACLSYIKEHMVDVIKLPAFAELMRAWPDVMLKLSLFSAGVPDTEASAALDVFKGNQTRERVTCHICLAQESLFILQKHRRAAEVDDAFRDGSRLIFVPDDPRLTKSQNSQNRNRKLRGSWLPVHQCCVKEDRKYSDQLWSKLSELGAVRELELHYARVLEEPLLSFGVREWPTEEHRIHSIARAGEDKSLRDALRIADFLLGDLFKWLGPGQARTQVAALDVDKVEELRKLFAKYAALPTRSHGWVSWSRPQSGKPDEELPSTGVEVFLSPAQGGDSDCAVLHPGLGRYFAKFEMLGMKRADLAGETLPPPPGLASPPPSLPPVEVGPMSTPDGDRQNALSGHPWTTTAWPTRHRPALPEAWRQG